MKKIGFLSFGHWTPDPQSQTQLAADALLQSIDLAMESERLGMDGAYFRVHHFARQLASPFPLLAAIGAKTRKIEIGTAVIDMRYENPHYMAEDAGAADLIAGGRLQLGISRGSPEQVIDGWRYFSHRPAEGENDGDMGRRHAEEFLELLRGRGFAQPNPRSDVSQSAGAAASGAVFGRIARSYLVGVGFQCDSRLGRNARNESANLDPQIRRNR
jgi:alkanesulfonate monooxygenase SsuD/methylene tetrahydromethanopterin reductase-like flavin-dependent oxidoreductase (luciferase family)